MKAFLLACLVSIPAFGIEAPPYLVRVGLEPASKIPRWLVELTPPAGHHFNVSAPMKVESGTVVFKPLIKKDRILGFAASSLELKETDRLETSAFLCDDAKTYCVKKSVSAAMKPDPSLQEIKTGVQGGGGSAIKSESTIKSASTSGGKDQNGFWVGNPDAALSEAARTGKPILIDFFGVWCPPCNQYDERVFNGRKFRNLSKNLVLLKMDADRESSFALKSHLKVGGYPTLILAKPGGTGISIDSKVRGVESLSEIGRVVGFRPEAELVSEIGELLSLQSMSLEERIATQREALVKSMKLKIDAEMEGKNVAAALQLLDDADAVSPGDLELGMRRIQVRSMDSASFQWGESDSAIVRKVMEVPKHRNSRLLLSAVSVFVSAGALVPVTLRVLADPVIRELRDRMNPKTLSIPGTEVSESDLEGLELDLGLAFSDEARIKKARAGAISSLQKQIQISGNRASRALNLELAGLLAQDGQHAKARTIYETFIRKYPKEFTFHLGAARVCFEMKELGSARAHAEEAVRHAYGDNLIRSMDWLVKIMHQQGESAFALRRGEEFLSGIQLDPSLRVRTERYVSALSRTLEAVRKEKHKP